MSEDNFINTWEAEEESQRLWVNFNCRCIVNPNHYYDENLNREDEGKMNLTNTIFLVNDKVRAVKATYEPGTENQYVNASGAKIKDPVFKTLDPSIKVGDIVVAATSTRHGFTTVKVTEVDLNIDFEDKTPIDWIVSRVDLDAHKALVTQEQELIEKVKKAEFKVRQSQLLGALNLEGEALTSLPLAAKG